MRDETSGPEHMIIAEYGYLGFYLETCQQLVGDLIYLQEQQNWFN